MTDILDLENWHVLSKARKDAEYEIEAEYTVQPEACQKCGVIGELYRHGPKVISYRDSPIRRYPSTGGREMNSRGLLPDRLTECFPFCEYPTNR